MSPTTSTTANRSSTSPFGELTQKVKKCPRCLQPIQIKEGYGLRMKVIYRGETEARPHVCSEGYDVDCQYKPKKRDPLSLMTFTHVNMSRRVLDTARSRHHM